MGGKGGNAPSCTRTTRSPRRPVRHLVVAPALGVVMSGRAASACLCVVEMGVPSCLYLRLSFLSFDSYRGVACNSRLVAREKRRGALKKLQASIYTLLCRGTRFWLGMLFKTLIAVHVKFETLCRYPQGCWDDADDTLGEAVSVDKVGVGRATKYRSCR